jgi:16S rRNA (cytosine967-C5)-methyltransferase
LSSWEKLFGKDAPRPRSSDGKTITLTPASTDTDGFFFCRLQRKA